MASFSKYLLQNSQKRLDLEEPIVQVYIASGNKTNSLGDV
jgi:hypothetical protein